MMLLNDLIEYHSAWGTLSGGGGVNLDDAWLRESRIQEDPTIDFVGYWDAATPATHDHNNLYVSVWRREGWGLAVLVNYGAERIEAEVAFDPAGLGLAGLVADAVRVRDVDKGLVQYFDDDVTLLEKLKVTELVMEPQEEEEWLTNMPLEQPPTLAERKAADPDAVFEWKDGVLRAPVRGYDFRLFEFTAPKEDTWKH